MNILLRGIIGGFACGGAPRPSVAGSTRKPGCSAFGGGRGSAFCGGGGLSAGDSGGNLFKVPEARPLVGGAGGDLAPPQGSVVPSAAVIGAVS
jgi:hypothetical protein